VPARMNARCAIASTCLLLAACGGTGGEEGRDHGPGPGCPTCSSLVEAVSYGHHFPYTTFGGYVLDVRGYASAPPYVTVTWTNLTTGRSGRLDAQTFAPSCGFFDCSWDFQWFVTVPLAAGSNRIRLTLEGSVEDRDEVTVTYEPSSPGLELAITSPDPTLQYDSFADLLLLHGHGEPSWQVESLVCMRETPSGFALCDEEVSFGDDGWALAISLLPGVNSIIVIGFSADGRQWASQFLTVTFHADQANPVVAVPDTLSAVIDAPGRLEVLANDESASGYPLAVLFASTAAHGSVTIESDGSLGYTPAPGYSGEDRFTYIVGDGHGGAARAAVIVWVSIAPGRPLRRISDPIRSGCEDRYGDSSDGDVSAGGRYVAFVSCFNPRYQYQYPNYYQYKIVRYDVLQDRFADVSVAVDGGEPDGDSETPVISADGSSIAFTSRARNLTSDPMNGDRHVFRRDLDASKTVLASPDCSFSSGSCVYRDSFAPSINARGTEVAFYSTGCVLGCGDLPVSGDYVFGEALSYEAPDAAFGDRPALSATGRFLAYVDYDRWLKVRERATGRTTTICRCGGGPTFSRDERQVAFLTSWPLVPEDANGFVDAYVYDLASARLTLASVGDDGGTGNGPASELALSADGRFGAFVSAASNLVSGDTNGYGDVFVRDLLRGRTARVSVGPTGSQFNSDSRQPSMTATGEYVVFTEANNVFMAPNPLAQ